jgi:Fe-S-cluster containining protein
MRRPFLPAGDRKLIQIMDAALVDATRRSGPWLVCRSGCTQCCVGVFAISQLDAARLKSGLAELEQRDPARAAAVRARSREAASRLASDFPGDPSTGILAEDEASEARFEDLANDEVCPVLDPSTGLCDLYESRPMTCRTFGPPVRSEDGLGVCELCYHGASDEEISSCEMEVDPDDLEGKLLKELEARTGARGQTIIAFALRD